MLIEKGKASGGLIDAVYDCRHKKVLENVVWVNTDLRQYAIEGAAGQPPVAYNAARMIVSNRVVYIDPMSGIPLPTVPHRAELKKHWRG